MATYLIPLQDILTDPDNPVDLTALPEAEAIERIKQTYGYWGALLDVRIENGVAVIDLPDENASKAGAALDKISQAARAGRAGRYQQAITLYGDALKILPQHTEARRELAMAQMELGNSAAAKQNLIRVLQLDPKDAWAYLILGNLYFKHERDLGSAERYYATAADLASEDPYILNSYGGLLAQRGRFGEAQEILRRAVAAKPDYVNPHLGLAMAAARQGDEKGASEALERLFALPADPDARSGSVYAEARRLYAEQVRRRAARREEEALAEVRAAMAAYTARTGIEIRLLEDPKIKTDARTEFAWRYGRPHHAIRYAGGGASSHVIAHEFEHILLDESLREAGVNQLYGTSAQTRQRALASVEKEVRKIRERRRVPARDLDRFVEDIMDGLTNQLYNMPLDLFIESRVHADFPALYDAQFAGLARQTAENAQILRDPQMRELIPPRVFGASTAMNAAFALFVDDLFGGRTAYAEAYQPAGALPTGRKLYALFRKMSDDKRPGVEYALVDAWADELRLRDWCLWLPDEGAAPSSVSLEEARTAGHRTAQQTTAMREGGATNLEYLADPMVQMSATMYMLGALQRFSKMELEQVEAVALEIAVIGMQGINYIAGQEQYTLRTLPDEQFSGMQLLCMEYVGFKMTHPELNPAIPLDDAYKSAKGMFDAGMGR